MKNVKVRVELKSEYASKKASETVSKSLQADNLNLDDFQVETFTEGRLVITRIQSNKLESVKAALDDLIRNQKISEKLTE